jgi:hypothetical protein
MLKEIDRFNGWTMWFRADGIIGEKETWWENVLDG